MKKLNTSILSKFIMALVASVMMPAGLIMLIAGLSSDLDAMWVIGICCLLAGFYATPFLWIAFGTTRELKVVLRLIENSGLTGVDEIAEQISAKPKDVKARIIRLIEKGYLTGYIFKDGELVENEKLARKKAVGRKCENCGAMMEKQGGNYVCLYCGNSRKI